MAIVTTVKKVAERLNMADILSCSDSVEKAFSHLNSRGGGQEDEQGGTQAACQHPGRDQGAVSDQLPGIVLCGDHHAFHQLL